MSLIKRILDYLAPESSEQIEAEEENIVFDKGKVDEAFFEALKTARSMRKTADAFIAVGELYVKDIKERTNAKTSSRAKKS